MCCTYVQIFQKHLKDKRLDEILRQEYVYIYNADESLKKWDNYRKQLTIVKSLAKYTTYDCIRFVCISNPYIGQRNNKSEYVA